MSFSCYSKNEGMQKCTRPCEFCRTYYNALPKISKNYKINISGTNLSNAITIIVPIHLLTDLKLLKRKDKLGFNKALGKLIGSKL